MTAHRPLALSDLPEWLHHLPAAIRDFPASAWTSSVRPRGATPRAASVLILFGDGPHGPHVLLLERASTMRSHAGQVAFPGGAADADDADAIATALREAAEETALDIYPIEGHPEGYGYGRVGTLPGPMMPKELAERVSERLDFTARLVADPGRRVERVAALGGSGGSFIRDAAASGADAYITGDLSYHDALLAESLGLAAIDAGHAASELPALEPLARRLAELVDVPVEVSRIRR